MTLSETIRRPRRPATANARGAARAAQAINTSLTSNPSVLVTSTGMQINRRLSLDSWERLGEQLFAVSDSAAWWVADWLVFGESAFQDRYLEAARRTNLNHQTLRNYAWVARRFGPSRRREALTFGHHAELAALQEPEQDYWLRKAEELGWSRNRLRREVRASLRERQCQLETAQSGNDVQRDADPVIGQPEYRILQLRITPDQLAAFKSIADDRDEPIDQWAIEVLNATAGYELLTSIVQPS